MREVPANVVDLSNLKGTVMIALISAMYRKLTDIPDDIALPLYLAADAYQVRMRV